MNTKYILQQGIITRAGRHRVEVSALFLFFVLHLICEINLSPRYLYRLDIRVVSTSDSESVSPGSIPGRGVSNFFLFLFFLFYSS